MSPNHFMKLLFLLIFAHLQIYYYCCNNITLKLTLRFLRYLTSVHGWCMVYLAGLGFGVGPGSGWGDVIIGWLPHEMYFVDLVGGELL